MRDLRPATPAAITSANDDQDALAAVILADPEVLAAGGSPIAAVFLSALGDGVVGQALRNAIISKELELKMSTPEVVFGNFCTAQWEKAPHTWTRPTT